MGFANKMTPGVSEGILRAEQESKTFDHVSFSSKRGLQQLEKAFLAIWKNCRAKH